MGDKETWTLLLSCHTDFNHPAWPTLYGQSLSKCIPVQLFTYTSSAPAGETRLSSFSLFEVWPSGWTSLLSPPPLKLHPIAATRRAHLKGFALRADTRRWLVGRWKHPASGRPYQWRQCCVTHRERTSCSTTLLLFLLQTAAIALSLSSYYSFLLAVKKRCGAGWWSTPAGNFFSSQHTLDYSPIPVLLSTFYLDFHWPLRSTLVGSL